MTADRWWARLSLLLALAAVVVIIVGDVHHLGALIAGIATLVVGLVGVWWFVSRRGVLRWTGAAILIAAPVFLLVFFIVRNLLEEVAIFLALAAGSVEAGRRARPPAQGAGMPEIESPAPRHPFVIMNPRSGGGKVEQFHLDTGATALGAEIALLDGPQQVDVSALARQAVAGGADLLGVAGGDGTQALVAGIASTFGLPFLVISAGTRNHLAMDLGLDRAHPDACLDALRDGVELCMDLGLIGDRTFVNNASFGAYAEIVQSPAYRDAKRATTLNMLPDLLTGQRGPRLSVSIDGQPAIDAPQALLVSNNPYELDDIAGLGRRARLDGGVLGVVAVKVTGAAQAADLIRGRHGHGVRRFVAHEVVVEADADEIPVGIDGEAVRLPTPVRCTIRPHALRVRVPRGRPGVPAPRPPLDARRVLQLAFGG